MRRLLIVLAALALMGCGNHYQRIATAHRVLGHVKNFVESFDRALASWLTSEKRRCLKMHRLKTAEFAACVGPALKLSRAWTGKVRGVDTGKGILPAIQSSQRTARLSLDAAYDYVKASGCKGQACEDKLNAWLQPLKLTLCATREIVDRAIKIGAYKAAQDPTYQTITGVFATLCAR
jgi:hypothetical protein